MPRTERDRGAEQGDVVGTVQSAPVFGDAPATHMQGQLGACEAWFVDDGKVFARRTLFPASRFTTVRTRGLDMTRLEAGIVRVD